jgi:UDP-glucuronate 4-epimerase
MENILVTGGAGFIGSHVCDKLLELGKSVVCLDNLNSYYSPERKIKNIQHNFDNKNFVFVNQDIKNKDQLRIVFQKFKFDKILHLAARAGVRPSIEKPDWYFNTNVLGTLNLLECAKEFKINHFVSASSSSVYGNNKKVPFSESDNVDNPISPYAASKKAGELLCHTYSHLYGINISCLRFFTVYGPRGRLDMAPYLFTERIMKGLPIKKFGDGTTKRDYTFVGDIVKGIVACLEHPFKFEVINLGNNSPVELNRFISIIEKHTGKKAIVEECPIPLGDVDITFADISKAKKLLGFMPETSIEDGLKIFIDWFKSEGLDKN